MNEKILTADLVNAVAELTAIPKNRCDDFVKAFFEAIANALSIDGIVKVKGLGTFKLIAVEERKSVNVQTGAEMIIPAHAKVSFTPDKVLKDEINKPYAHLKTYVLNQNAPLDPPEVDDDEAVDDSLVENVDAVETEPAQIVAPVSVDEQLVENTVETVAEIPAANTIVEPVTVVDNADKVESVADAPIVDVAANGTVEEQTPVVSASADIPAVEEVKAEVETPVGTVEATVTETNTANKPVEEAPSHSDWFDNWEVEYEGEGVANPNALVSNNQNQTESVATQPVSVADEVVASIEQDAAEATVSVKETEAQVEADPVSAETVAENPTETTEVVSKAETPVEEIKAETVPEVEPAAESVADTVEGVADTTLDTDDGVVELNPAEPAQTDNDKAVEEGQFVCSKSNNYDEEEEVVNRKKVLGVGIIAFLVVLGAAFFGIQKIDPDFFKTLKASSDNPPVMPADTTSLAQELSIYTPDTVVTASDMAEMAEDSAEPTEQNETPAEVEETPVVSNTIDPLWNGEFVAYMKRQHKDVSLATSGLIGETAIKPGLFLTMVALQNYGDKSYWIYLYLYNTDRIKNPNNVPVGTKIRVPNLDKSLVNGPNEEQVNLAKEIRQKFVK